MAIGMKWIAGLFSPTSFDKEKRRHKERLERAFSVIDRLNVDDEHKGMFAILLIDRGIVNIEQYESMLEQIGNNSCDIIKALIYNKMYGIETIHKFSMCSDKHRREEAFALIKKNGVTGNEENIDMILLGESKYEKTLLDFIEDTEE